MAYVMLFHFKAGRVCKREQYKEAEKIVAVAKRVLGRAYHLRDRTLHERVAPDRFGRSRGGLRLSAEDARGRRLCLRLPCGAPRILPRRSQCRSAYSADPKYFCGARESSSTPAPRRSNR